MSSRQKLVSRRLRNSLLGILHNEGTAQEDRRLVDAVVLVAQGAHATGLHQERGALLQRFADPAHGEGAQDVAVADYQHVACAAALRTVVVGGGG